MTTEQKYLTLLTRVKSGESIKSCVASIYGHWDHYRNDCSESQRKQVKAARMEYRAYTKTLPVKVTKYPRFSCNTTIELHKAVKAHCKEHGIDVSKFLNSAARAALRKLP